MGKRTMRLIHFNMVANVLQECRESSWIIGEDAEHFRKMNRITVDRLAHHFADEFEIRAELFDRKKFLKSCGLEGE